MGIKAVILVAIVAAVVGIVLYKHNQPVPEVPITWTPAWWGAGAPKPDDPTIRPFKISVDDSILKDLKTRLANTRYISSLENGDFYYGFQANYLKEVVSYWKDKFDWRKQEAIINSFPNFKTKIQGIDVHFIHAKPKSNVKGKPLLIMHGWPGSIWEFYKLIPMLTEPENHGGKAEDAFEVIAPSIPGYGFSEAPHQKGFAQSDAARMFVELMKRLGHDKFYVHGGDWGAIIGTFMSANYPSSVKGVHLTMFTASQYDGLAFLHNIAQNLFPSIFLTAEEREFVKKSKFSILFILQETGYFHLQATKPDTVGSSLVDSPAGLAAYILEKFSTWTESEWTNLEDGGLTRKFTLDELLTNVMLYWISGNIASSQRFYKEYFLSPTNQLLDSLPVVVPAGLASFPNELAPCLKAIASYRFKNITQYTLMPRGGHFASFEEPALVAQDLSSFVRKVEQNKNHL